MRICAILTLLLVHTSAAGLIPRPRIVQGGDGGLVVDVQTRVIAAKNLAGHAEVLIKALEKSTGFVHQSFTPEKVGRRKFRRSIRLGLADSEKEAFYRLEVTSEEATIIGSDRAGLMHGVQTFTQLLPVGADPIPRSVIAAQVIEDWPATARRIFHLDVSAHLFPTDDLKILIDWLSFHKLNEFHLQLNGDHGWRMESLKYPKLHEIGSVRASTPPYGDPTGSDSTEYGGYYSQENLKDLVSYAQSREVEIVPTFTFAEGASAIIAAYPDLGKAPVEVANTWEDRKVGLLPNEKSLQFIDQILKETATIFPSLFVRIQGEGGLNQQVTEVLAKQKKELFEPRNVVTSDFSVYSRPKDAELLFSPKREAEEGFNPVRKVFDLKVDKIAQATLRTRNVREIGKLHHLVFPRIAAFASATWEPTGSRNYEDFRTCLDDLTRRYHNSGIKSSLAYDPPAAQALGGTIITSSLISRELHPHVAIFDGDPETFFWSRNGLNPEDHLTLEFPWPINGDLTIATGRAGGIDPTAPGVLLDGVLELSPDGKKWDSPVGFFDGLTTTTVPKGTRFARIRITAGQDDPLVLHEITLSEPLLMPRHKESRIFEYSLTDERVELTFQADFSGHPEFREEIDTIRRIFFAEWYPLGIKLGVAFLPDTPRGFAIKPGEPGEMSPKEARTWFLKRWIPALQNYPANAPRWFATGMVSNILGDLPENPVKLKNLDGGPESAAFLDWISKKYGEDLLTAVSQDCRAGRYDPSLWKILTKFTLEELSGQYQDQN
jgi:hypothetical protein